MKFREYLPLMSSAEQIVVDFSAVAWGDLNAYEWGDLGGSTWGGLNNGALERIVAETTLTVSKDWAKGVLNFTVNYDLSADAEIHYKVLIDDAVEWELVEQQTAGKIVKTITTPVSIWSATETQPHNFKVTMGGRTEES